MSHEKTVSVLNDLLQITNDRIEGFSKVENKVWENYSDLKADYDEMVANSHKMKSELSGMITEREGKPENTATAAGAVHRAWIDVKNAFSGNTDETTLGNVVFGEEAAIKAYADALDSGALYAESSKVVQDQLHHLRSSYNKFENLEMRKS